MQVVESLVCVCVCVYSVNLKIWRFPGGDARNHSEESRAFPIAQPIDLLNFGILQHFHGSVTPSLALSGWQILGCFSLYTNSQLSCFQILRCPQWQSSQLNSWKLRCVRACISSCNRCFDHFQQHQQIIVALSTSCLCFLSPQSAWFLPSAAGQMGPYGTLIMNSTLMSDPSFIYVWSLWRHTLQLSEYPLWNPSKKRSIRQSLDSNVCLVPFPKRTYHVCF